MAEMKGSERSLQGSTSADWICDSCVHGPPSSFGGKPCVLCNPNDQMLNFYQKREEPVTTNADRIRSMSDEELAGLLCDTSSCHTCLRADECLPGEDGWLNWLKSPAGEVEDDET